MQKLLFAAGCVLLIASSGFVGCGDDSTNPLGANDDAAAAPGAGDGEITEARAEQIALGRVPGKVLETEREKENGKMVYEIEIQADAGGVKEVTVDASNGDVLEIENEDDEDDDDDDGKFLGIF